MEYTIQKKRLPIRYRNIRESREEPYWVSDAKPYTPQKPITFLHYHDMYELGVCIEGRGNMQIDDRLYSFEKGDIVFICRYVPHYARSYSSAPARWKQVFFDPVRLMQLAGMLDPDKAISAANIDIPFSGVFSPMENPELTAFVKEIIMQGDMNDEFTDISLAFSIGRFIISCARYMRTNGILSKSVDPKRDKYRRILPAVDMINAHLSNSDMLKEESLADLCKISVSTLRRLFVKHTGLSPKNYINKTRMSWAEYLLQNTEMTVAQIALEVGYSEISGFNRIFNNTFSTSPSEYRKKIK